MNINIEDELLTADEVARVLKTDYHFVHKLRKSGLLKCVYLKGYKVRKKTLVKFLEDHDGEDFRMLLSEVDENEK